MKRKFYIWILITCVFAFKFPVKEIFIVPKSWPKPYYDFSKNPLTKEKINLGRALFYDPILSLDNTISCASCHSPYNAFAHVDHALSHGIEDRIGTRNAPALMNLAWQSLFMWDGAINHLDMQALFPITHPDEMNESFEHVIAKLQHSNIYPSLYKKAFNDTIITGEHSLKAISQFMITLVSASSKYDSVMLKQTNFNTKEKNGYQLFKINCSTCHTEPFFTNYQFKNNGLPVDKILNDQGRMRVTQNLEDSLKFKVPTLRNVEFSYPYMHDGRFRRLSDVLMHYTSGIHKTKTLAQELDKPIILTSKEKVDLISFLLTLSDKNFIFNSNFSFPKDILFPDTKN